MKKLEIVDGEVFIPQNEVEHYQYLLHQMSQVVEQEKFLGSEFALQSDEM
jgi:hypothetical protein